MNNLNGVGMKSNKYGQSECDLYPYIYEYTNLKVIIF